jgi:murein DD-endopeptidase MepM/ murein hydrolase activator NlpD
MPSANSFFTYPSRAAFRPVSRAHRTFVFLAAFFTLTTTTLPTSTLAQTKKPAPHKSAAPTWTKTDCGQGIELRLSASHATQGSLLLAELRSAAPLADVTAKLDDKDIAFWPAVAGPPKASSTTATPASAKSRASSTSPKPLDLRRALVGIDLQKPAGSFDLAVTANTGAANPITCSAAITVRAGKFATENLKVAPNFAQPNPEQLARAEEDGKKLQAIYATITPEKFWTGRFRIPLDGVKTGGNFGKRRVLNGQASSPHTGVDMPAPTGTAVHAAQRGRVALAEETYFGGNTVVVDHGWGLYTLYAHFSEIDVKPGDMVDKGDVIGKVGATGRVTGPHLHWGLVVDRARVNALSIVPLNF